MCEPADLPWYIPVEWADRIEIVIDFRGLHYIWTGWHNGQGHGKVSIDGKTWYTHRWIYSKFHKVVLERFTYVDHCCERKGCMNITHLEAVPPITNTARGPGARCQFRRREPYVDPST
jgi:hypothetical protein